MQHTITPIFNTSKLVLFGGVNWPEGYLNDTWVYDFNNDTWTSAQNDDPFFW